MARYCKAWFTPETLDLDYKTTTDKLPILFYFFGNFIFIDKNWCSTRKKFAPMLESRLFLFDNAVH